jgi:6-pyruvoyltetrahydropterin/6-carboxytetrahydropterin synthase
MIIHKTFRFDSAHYLPNVPKGHKCGGMHGHTYTLKVYITGKHGICTGWIMNFTNLKNKVKSHWESPDHKVLHNIAGLENSTAEVLCIWLWQKMQLVLPNICKIELNEIPDSGVIYEG